MNLKQLTEQAESEQYAECGNSGRGKGDMFICKDELLKSLKPIALRKPMAMIVGSVATQGSSDNDVDIVIRGEDLSEKVKEAINFRIYRHFTDILGCAYDDIRKYVHIHYNNAGSYTSYVPIYELVLKPMNQMDAIQMSSLPVHLRGGFHQLSKAEDHDRVIAGYASVIEIDKENQVIPKTALEEGIQSLLENSEYSNLMLVHQNIQVGKIISEYGDVKTHVDDKGLFIVAKIRSDLDTSNQVWKLIVDGKLNGFSIAGEIVRAHDECDDSKCVKIIDKLNIFEVSVCDKPVNTKSGFVILSKGEGKPAPLDEMNVINKGELTMKKKTEDTVETEEKTEPEETPTEEEVTKEDEIAPEPEAEPEHTLEQTIEELAREVVALRGIIEDMQNKEPEEEPPEEEIPEEEMPEEEEEKTEEEPPVEEQPVEEKKQDEEEEEEPSKYPYPSKKDFDDLKKSVDTIIKSMDSFKKVGEIETIVKSKDKEISALTDRIKMLEEAEAKPQTTTEEPKDEEMYTGIKLVKDSIEDGVYYRDPDY